MERTRNVSGASLQVDKEPKDHYYDVLQCLHQFRARQIIFKQ